MIDERTRQRLRAAVRFFYDLQKLRIVSLQRVREKKPDEAPTQLDPEDQAYIDLVGKKLHDVERDALKEVNRHSEKYGAIHGWLREIRGVGPTIAGFLLAEFDPAKAPRPSCFWSFAGLGVEEGHAPQPKKGEKLKWNRWLRSKCVFVLGGSLLKAGNETYRPVYDGYRHRKETMIGPCMLCGGKGKAVEPKKPRPGQPKPAAGEGKLKKCWNCDGTGTGPWGRGDAHRHTAATRVMVKQFLLDFWKEWRAVEGLPVAPSYHEAVQGHVHAA